MTEKESARLDTVAKYRRAVGGLFRRAADEIGHEASVFELVGFCEAFFPSLSRATIRFYTHSLLWYFRRMKLTFDPAGQQLYLRIVNLKFIESAHDLLGLEKRTSARIQKHCSKEKLDKILNTLADSLSVYAPLACCWLVSTEMLGLRPCEFPSVWLDSDRDSVKITNAKQQDGKRAFEGARTLRLRNWTRDQQECLSGAISLHRHLVHRLMARGRSQQEAIGLVYAGVRQCIRTACKRLGDPTIRVGLYSMRHQFVANHRASTTSLELSVMLGQRSNTHEKFYGRAQTGRRPPAHVSASRVDVDTVLKIKQAQGKQKPWTRVDAAHFLRGKGAPQIQIKPDAGGAVCMSDSQDFQL